MYEHRYKHGKKKTIMSLATFEAAIQDAVNRGESLEHIAFCIGLWHTGVRKSELYERPLNDATVTEEFVIVNFHKRKKGGDEVPPLKIPRSFYGVNDYLAAWIQERQKSKPPHLYSWKSLFFQHETAKTRVTPKGKKVTIKETVKERRRDIWLFPHVHSWSAWQLVKRILGEEYYPHYLRLRKLSKIGGNPKTKSIIHLKSVSGIKSIRALEAYMGVDQEAQDEAMQQNE